MNCVPFKAPVSLVFAWNTHEGGTRSSHDGVCKGFRIKPSTITIVPTRLIKDSIGNRTLGGTVVFERHARANMLEAFVAEDQIVVLDLGRVGRHLNRACNAIVG